MNGFFFDLGVASFICLIFISIVWASVLVKDFSEKVSNYREAKFYKERWDESRQKVAELEEEIRQLREPIPFRTKSAK